MLHCIDQQCKLKRIRSADDLANPIRFVSILRTLSFTTERDSDFSCVCTTSVVLAIEIQGRVVAFHEILGLLQCNEAKESKLSRLLCTHVSPIKIKCTRPVGNSSSKIPGSRRLVHARIQSSRVQLTCLPVTDDSNIFQSLDLVVLLQFG
jgi:hypothetical protein